MKSTNAKSVIKKLRFLFSHFGLPDVLVSDNGPPFFSAEFETFLQMNGIKHLFSPPYHAQSNVSPSKMMFGRNIKTRLDLIRPSQKLINDLKVQSQIDNFGGKQRNFELGEKVVVKDFSNKEPTWIPGEISRKSGNVTFDIALEKGKIVRRHSNQIRSRMSASSYTDPTAEATAELATENQCSDLIEKSSCVSEDISIDPETAIIGSDAPLAAGNRYNLRSRNKS
nr:uncharacterized protein LOC111502345 [Leptinotarsa decemlineata]